MDLYIARQPILDESLKIIAYELLYRDDLTNHSSIKDDFATSNVLINSLLLMGLETLSENKRIFVKFTNNFIVNEIATLFSPELLTIEVLENSQNNPSVIPALEKLKAQGYEIALDEYKFKDTNSDILSLANIIKIDFRQFNKSEIIDIAKFFKNAKVKLFAEKVESKEQFEFAKSLGFNYFQGYFFEEPTVQISKHVQSFSKTHIKILKELNNEHPNYNNISKFIETDMGLVYQLLKLVNSAAYSSNRQITSIQQALVRLGIKEIFKWMTLIMLQKGLHANIEELVKISLTRARIMETVAKHVNQEDRKTAFFIVGMFSLINTIMQRPMEDILNELEFDEEINNALLGKEGLMLLTLDFIRAVEKGMWKKTEEFEHKVNGLSIDKVFMASNEARHWVKKIYE